MRTFKFDFSPLLLQPLPYCLHTVKIQLRVERFIKVCNDSDSEVYNFTKKKKEKRKFYNSAQS
jgi:hypothetical protein